MDELEIQGKIYISSKRASEITGYAKDYVGQLARAGKVPGTRVGRSWYVAYDAIKAHAGIVQAEVTQSDTEGVNGAPLPLVSRINQENTHSLNTIKYGDKTNVFKSLTPFSYLEDARDIIPEMVKKDEHEEKINLVQTDDYKKITLNIDSSLKRPDNIATFDGVSLSKNNNPAPVELVGNDRRISIDKTSTTDTLKKPLSSRKKPLKAPFVALMALASMFIFVVLPLISSISHEWSYGNSVLTQSSANSFQIEFSLILDYFKVLFDSGIAVIHGFISLFVSSIAEFFDLGINFLSDLLNLD